MPKHNAIFVIELKWVNYDNWTLNFNVIAKFLERDSDDFDNIKNMIFDL